MPRKKAASQTVKLEETASVALPALAGMSSMPELTISLKMEQGTAAGMEVDESESLPIASTSTRTHDDPHLSDLTPVHSEAEVDVEEKPKKAKRVRKPKVPKALKVDPVYVIPDVQTKELKHAKGVRYGYACLNTVLRNIKPARDAIFCSRTLRLDTLSKNGIGFMKDLGKQNARDLLKLVQWNEENHIKFMRISSEMFPFASHPEHGYTLEFADEELKAVGDFVKKHGHRLTSHPGQFTQLGSPRQQVVDNAFRDLIYHTEMMERMGMDQDSVMIIHGGGTFGDKEATLVRIKENFKKLPENVQKRVVLENDELCYNADDLLPLCEELSIPFVFDWHHDWIFPSSQTPKEMMPRILATWEKRGIRCKQHLSEPRPGAMTTMEKRAHSDRIKNIPVDLPDNVDLMLEAKDKEQAVLELYRIYEIAPVNHDSLRPPAEEESLLTKGRKSHKKKKSTDETAEEDVEAEVADLDEAAPKKRKRVKKEVAKQEDDENATVDLGDARVGLDDLSTNAEESHVDTPEKPKAKKRRVSKKKVIQRDPSETVEEQVGELAGIAPNPEDP